VIIVLKTGRPGAVKEPSRLHGAGHRHPAAFADPMREPRPLATVLGRSL
jgi:hypothetical protein